MDLVFVELLNEGTSCFRGVKAQHLGGEKYRLIGPWGSENYDPNDEEWSFVPGSEVYCEYHTFDDGLRAPLARRLARVDHEEILPRRKVARSVAANKSASLEFLVGRKLVGLVSKKVQLEMCFNPAAKIWVMSRLLVQLPQDFGRDVIDFESNAELLQKLLKQEVKEIRSSTPNSLLLYFSDGAKLWLTDDSEIYESFAIEIDGGQTLVW